MKISCLTDSDEITRNIFITSCWNVRSKLNLNLTFHEETSLRNTSVIFHLCRIVCTCVYTFDKKKRIDQWGGNQSKSCMQSCIENNSHSGFTMRHCRWQWHRSGQYLSHFDLDSLITSACKTLVSSLTGRRSSRGPRSTGFSFFLFYIVSRSRSRRWKLVRRNGADLNSSNDDG